MPRSQGTSRKGKPKKKERAAGMGRALQKAQEQRFRPKSNGSSQGNGMHQAPGTTSIGIAEDGPEKTMLSVLEMDDLADFLGQAEMANREFVSEREQFVMLDETGTQVKPDTTRVTFADTASPNNDFVFKELGVPRRPAWTTEMTKDDLDKQERTSFLEWRRAIAARENMLLDSGTRVTPFEKNLEVWRQLWRVLERCSCILQIVDARNPLFYLSSDLRQYAVEELGKPMLLLVNKSDYLTKAQRKGWHHYFKQQGWDHLFFSAWQEQQILDDAATEERKATRDGMNPFHDHDETDGEDNQNAVDEAEAAREPVVETTTPDRQNIGLETPLSRQELLAWLNSFATQYKCEPDARYENRVQFGMVGFPNVGKSSVINVLVGSSKHAHGVVRVGVAAQPGKTKHFQTLLLPDRDDIMLCDCPGLVFPSFVSSAADLIAAGVYPIAQMRDPWPVVELICKRIPREVLNATYGIKIATPKEHRAEQDALPPPTGEELLSTYCVARSMLAASSGVPDYQRAARIIIKDYADGKLLYCHAPPCADGQDFQRETLTMLLDRIDKLKEKYEIAVEKHKQQPLDAANQDDDDDDEFDDIENDLDILEAMEGLGTDDNPVNGGKRGKAHKKINKWGKKGRKIRNSDPYGCHSTPDDKLLGGAASSGVVVNAGKKRQTRRDYERPARGSRGVAVVPSVEKRTEMS